MSKVIEQGELPYQGRTGVFYGGSGGTGLVAAVEFQNLGGTVVLGASSELTFKRGLANARYFGGDRTTIKPLTGSVTDTDLLLSNIRALVDSQDEEGKPVTDIFSFAASGMPFAMDLDRDYLGPMNKIVIENPPNRDELLEAKKAELRRQYAVWLPASRDEAIAVNYQAKINIINGFLEAYRGRHRLVFLDANSIFGKEGLGYGFYKNVAETKHDFSLWLAEHADEHAAAGMDTAEITAPIIEDTDVGKILLTKVNPLLLPELAAVIVRTKIRRIHVFEAMREFLDMTSEERAREGRPYDRYVMGDDGNVAVLRSIPEELRIDTSKLDI